MLRWILDFENKILDILFPIRCLSCGRAARLRQGFGEASGWVCDNCLGFMHFEGVFLCPRCGNQTYIGRACKRCADKSYLNGAVAMGKYSDKFLQKLIKSLKFRYITDLESVFDKLVKRFCLKYSAVFPQNATVIPVPLHPIRFRERGFNQAEYIAKFVSGALGYEILNVLQRVRYTYRQSELPKEMREKNIKGAFQYCYSEPQHIVGAKNLAGAERPANKVPEVVILVDDVYTSGGTMQECAKVLKAAGVKEVWGFVLARG